VVQPGSEDNLEQFGLRCAPGRSETPPCSDCPSAAPLTCKSGRSAGRRISCSSAWEQGRHAWPPWTEAGRQRLEAEPLIVAAARVLAEGRHCALAGLGTFFVPLRTGQGLLKRPPR
jgi:hypothetical protein